MTRVQPGSVGVDWAGAGLKPAQLKADGAAFAVRYSAGVGNGSPNSAFKLCKPDELKDIIASGRDFIANSEWYESRVTEGYAAGLADGRADLAFWKTRGLAKNAVVPVSWDEYPHVAKYPGVEQYLRGWRAGSGGYYRVGLYAGSAAIRHFKALGLISMGWQMMSTSFSDNGLPYQPSKAQVAAAVAHPPAGINVWQTGNRWYNNGADEDVVLQTPVGSHLDALETSGIGDIIMALTTKDAATLLHTDGVLAAPEDASDYATNKFWAWSTHITSTTQAVRGIAKIVVTIPARLAALQKQQDAILAELKELRAARVNVIPTAVPVTGTLQIGASQ